jgi:hypothetical protein
MPSPFPGMNPYLEQEDVWHDFHERFLPLASELLVPQVRPRYIVKLDQHVYVHEHAGDERRYIGGPDLSVIESGQPASRLTASLLLDAPAYGMLPIAENVERETFIEIRDRLGREMVTIIELLSPSNKQPGPGREQYLGKRRELLASNVHVVELDLLRGGQRMPIAGLPTCDYCAIVSRAEERPRAGIWPISLRDPLPMLPIPLRGSDPDAHLDLQALLHRLYDAAGYADYIYSDQPSPALSSADAKWAEQLVAV